jgi:HKD family nuclease
MSVTTTVLFDRPQQEIASLIQARLETCETAKIVTGFATPGGLAAIARPIRARPGILSTFIVGAGTYPAFQALDELISAGVSPGSLFVHLGHAVDQSANKSSNLFRTMLHSKIYYFENTDGTASAFIGSNNMTSYAMRGLNGEACVLLEGSRNEPSFAEIRAHIEEACLQARPYDDEMKSAYSVWASQYLKGLLSDIGTPVVQSRRRTILVFAVAEPGLIPKKGDVVFFQIPLGIKKIDTHVHLFLFESLPKDPFTARKMAPNVNRKFDCIVCGAENRKGYTETDSRWKIVDCKNPVLEFVPEGNFRPTSNSTMQQARAEVLGDLCTVPNYLFGPIGKKYEPVLSKDPKFTIYPKYLKDNYIELNDPDLPDSSKHWQLVEGLVEYGGRKRKGQKSKDLWAGVYADVSSGIALPEQKMKRKPKRQGELFASFSSF